MISRTLSEDQIRDLFEQFIESPSGGVPSDSGFDVKTQSAMTGVAMNPTPENISHARIVLERQLNGSHQREEDAKMEAVLKNLEKRK